MAFPVCLSLVLLGLPSPVERLIVSSQNQGSRRDKANLGQFGSVALDNRETTIGATGRPAVFCLAGPIVTRLTGQPWPRRRPGKSCRPRYLLCPCRHYAGRSRPPAGQCGCRQAGGTDHTCAPPIRGPFRNLRLSEEPRAPRHARGRTGPGQLVYLPGERSPRRGPTGPVHARSRWHVLHWPRPAEQPRPGNASDPAGQMDGRLDRSMGRPVYHRAGQTGPRSAALRKTLVTIEENERLSDLNLRGLPGWFLPHRRGRRRS